MATLKWCEHCKAEHFDDVPCVSRHQSDADAIIDWIHDLAVKAVKAEECITAIIRIEAICKDYRAGEGREYPATDEMRRMAENIAKEATDPSEIDIEQWAKRLSDDVAGAND